MKLRGDQTHWAGVKVLMQEGGACSAEEVKKSLALMQNVCGCHKSQKVLCKQNFQLLVQFLEHLSAFLLHFACETEGFRRSEDWSDKMVLVRSKSIHRHCIKSTLKYL